MVGVYAQGAPFALAPIDYGQDHKTHEQDRIMAPQPVAALRERLPMIAGGVLAWALVVFGVTNVLTTSKLAAPLRRLPRQFGALFRCPMCAGFWVGVWLFVVAPTIGPAVAFDWPLWAKAVASGFASSAVCWIAHVILTAFGADRL
jgi:hypothetical protein